MTFGYHGRVLREDGRCDEDPGVTVVDPDRPEKALHVWRPDLAPGSVSLALDDHSKAARVDADQICAPVPALSYVGDGVIVGRKNRSDRVFKLEWSERQQPAEILSEGQLLPTGIIGCQDLLVPPTTPTDNDDRDSGGDRKQDKTSGRNDQPDDHGRADQDADHLDEDRLLGFLPTGSRPPP